MWALPLVGLIVGGISAMVFALGYWIGLGLMIPAVFAVGAGALATGVFHEDGLGDVADGFGGGWDRDAKLRIMKDSRLGTYGTVTLIAWTLLKIIALVEIASRSANPILMVGAALLLAHALGRCIIPFALYLYDQATEASAAKEAGKPDETTLILTALLAIAIGLPLGGLAFSLIAAGLLALIMAAMDKLANQQIGGITGDVLGAMEQIAEAAILCLIILAVL